MTTDHEPGAVIERTVEEAYAAFEAERYDRAGELLARVAAVATPEVAKPLWFDAVLCAVRMRDWSIARHRGLEAVRFVERGANLATLAVVVIARSADDIEALAARFAQDGFGMEVLNSRVDRCSCCSEGTHQSERGRFDGEQPLFVAAPEETARALLNGWAQDRPDARSWTDLHSA